MVQRIRQSIPVMGINTAEPCHAVADGSMEDLYNLRYRNGAFESVCQPEVVYSISNDNGFRILHKMECLPAALYIAIRVDELHVVSISDTGVITSVSVIGRVDNNELRLHHFGNVLYANFKQEDNLKELSWIYKDDKFLEFSLSNIAPPKYNISYDCKLAKNTGERPIGAEDVEGTLLLRRAMKESGDSSFSTEDAFEYGISLDELHNEGYIVGDFMITLAYRLFDGSIVKLSNPTYISSYKPADGSNVDYNSLVRAKFHGSSNDTFEVYFYDKIRGIKPTITLTSSIPDNDIIKGAVLLSTRAQIIYDYDNVHKKITADGDKINSSPLGTPTWINRNKRTVIRDKELVFSNMPFYEIAEFEVGKDKTLTLNYDEHYKSITSYDVYKASYSLHDITSRGKYEYNNRLHLFDVSMSLFPGYDLAYYGELPTGYIYEYVDTVDAHYDVSLIIDDSTYVIRSSGKVKLCRFSGETVYVVLCNPMIYPDVRAKNVLITAGGYQKLLTFKKSTANNLAYCDTNDNDIWCWVNDLSFIAVTEATATVKPAKERVTVNQKNKLYVSSQNNPFFISPANIYTVGDNGSEIDSVETATEQITETKFGMYPLNVFTNKAIYALEAGVEEVLYSSVVGISNESKLPGTTTVGAGNLVFFIGERGVMAIEGRTVYCISSQLDMYAGLVRADFDFRLYKRKAVLMYNPIETELYVYNPDYNYAYIYSLTGKFWSRREWEYTKIGGTLSEIIIPEKGIASAWHENRELPVQICSFESRPVKLGSLDFKRIDTLVSRMLVGFMSSYTVYLDGSNDLDSWVTIGQFGYGDTIRRTAASFRYFRLRLFCMLKDRFSITNFDIEFYLRFVGRLR